MHWRSGMVRVGFVSLLVASAGCFDLGPEPAANDDVGSLGPPGTTEVVAIPRQSAWTYDTSGRDQGPTWRTWRGDSGWAEGDGPLGYGETYLSTTLPAAPVAYFRREFQVSDVDRIRKLYLRAMYDDGLVIYLNGHEVARADMPGGPVVYGTLALGHEADATYVTFDLSAHRELLRDDGRNLIAVEVHQQSASSSDLVFDAELLTWVDELEPGASSGVVDGAYWMFWDGGALG